MLRFENVTMRFASRVVVEGLTWSPPPGAVSVLTGNNGSGKTTLLKLASALLLPTGGEVWVGPLRSSCKEASVRSKISYLPADENTFYPRMNGWKNLQFFASLQNLPWEVSMEKARRLGRAFELEDDLSRPTEELSSGMKQKLNLIRCLMPDRSLYLLDEPERHLDGESFQTLIRLLQDRIQEGATILIALARHEPIFPGLRYRISQGEVLRVQG